MAPHRAAQQPQSGRAAFNRGEILPPETFTDQEIEALLQGVRKGWRGERLKGLVATWLGTGIRITETLDLLPGDIRDDHLLVRRGKGGKTRKVGFRSIWRPHLDNWIRLRTTVCQIQANSPVFCGQNGQPWASGNVRQALGRLRRRLKVSKRVHPHGFRHTHTMSLVRSGVGLAHIQRQLGHASLATTSRYVDHVCPQDLFDKVAAAL